jgi:folate-binding protein YgfZ
MSDGGVTAEASARRLGNDVDAITTRSGVVRGAHSLVWVRGPDAAKFLDGLISQSVAGTEPGVVRRSLLLSPQGKMRALLWVLGGEAAEVGLVTQRATESTLAEDLTRFRFRVDASIDLEDRPVVTLIGPGAADALLAAGVPRPSGGWLPTDAGLVAAIPFTNAGPPRYVLVGGAATAVTASAPSADIAAYESLRLTVGEPVGNIDFDETTIAQELGPVDDAVDFTKGCYLGQELVARIDSRGRVTQALRAVVVPGSVALQGAVLATAEREVGTVTSAAPSLTGDATIGLARVRHEVADGSVVTATVDGVEVAAAVRSLPLQAFG